MDKIAKKRSILNKIRENVTNVSAITAEKYFQPELLRVMDSLRKCDNDIRSIALGKPIENGDPGEDPIALKLLLKATTSNIARREYMLAISELSRFHKKLFNINSKLTKFNLDANKIHYQFLFKDLGQEHLERLKDLDQKRWKVEASEKIIFIRVAGITDIIHNVTSKRGRALAAWEKRYPKIIGNLRDKTIDILNKSNAIFNNLNNYFDELAALRANRDPNGYEEKAAAFSKEFLKYDSDFRIYYNGTVKPFFDKAKLFEESEKNEEIAAFNEANKADSTLPISSNTYLYNSPSSSNVSPLSPTLLATPEVYKNQTMPSIKINPNLNKVEKEVPLSSIDDNDFEPVSSVEKEVPLSSIDDSDFEEVKSAKFISTLESLATEDSSILLNYIKKYAKLIQEKDPKKAIALLNIVSRNK